MFARMFARTLACATIAATCLAAAAQAADIDARALYADKCSKCHFETGPDLANLKMSYKGAAIIVNSTGKPVDALLKSHHKVKMTTAETAAMMELFRRGLTWEAVYKEKCASCHGVGITFARATLKSRDGVAFAPVRDATVREVLATHGGASLQEADMLADMLRDQIGGAQ